MRDRKLFMVFLFIVLTVVQSGTNDGKQTFICECMQVLMW